MKREAVESTTMRSMGYDAKSKVLEIEFQSRVVYQYLDVPAAVHEELWLAESKGQYFNHEIRDCYACVRVDSRRAAGS
jgi:KTSC domain